MGHQELHTSSVETVNATYSILEFHGDLPKEYEAYIYSKWLLSLRYGSKFFKRIESRAYYRSYTKYLETLLARPDMKIKLAVLSDDKDVILGFCCFRGDILDYIYVHKDHRRQGIARALLPKSIKQFTHLTNIGTIIWQFHFKKAWSFNPFG